MTLKFKYSVDVDQTVVAEGLCTSLTEAKDLARDAVASEFEFAIDIDQTIDQEVACLMTRILDIELFLGRLGAERVYIPMLDTAVTIEGL